MRQVNSLEDTLRFGNFGEGRAAEDSSDVKLSPDGRWLVITVHQGWAKSEVFFKDRNRADAFFMPLVEKVDAIFDLIVRSEPRISDQERAERDDGQRLLHLQPALP